MMPYNLLLLPVIVGYFVLIYSSLFKYNTQRLSQNRIIFESVAVALIIITLGFALRTIIELIFPQLTPIIIKFLQIVPINKIDYLWTVVFSCIGTIALVLCANKFISKKYKQHQPIAWAVDINGDEIEKLFKKSVEDGIMIQITLKNDKVYIGFSEVIPIPHKTNYLTLTPMISGYRDKETKQLHITTDYFKVVQEFLDKLDGNNDNITLNTDVIIKQDEILTAGIYEESIYEMFNKPVTS